MLPENNERNRLFSVDGRKALADALTNHTEKALPGFVLVAEASGRRAGEIRNLKWCDIDLDTGLIQIHKPKNGEKRAVPVGGKALEWPKAWKAVTQLKGGGCDSRREDLSLYQPGFHNVPAIWRLRDEGLTGSGVHSPGL